MALFKGRVDVLSAFSPPSVRSGRCYNGPLISLDANDASSNHSAFQSLFAPVDTQTNENNRAKKRRKAADGKAVTVHQVETDLTKSIVLAKVSLDLESLVSRSESRAEESSSYTQNPLAVSLESFHVSHQAPAVRIVFRNTSSNAGIEVTATTDTRTLESTKPHLLIAAALYRKTSVSRAAFCHCRILPPTSDHDAYTLEVELRWTMGLSVVEDPGISAHYMNEDLKLLSRYFRNDNIKKSTMWALSDFYDAVHVPPSDLEPSPRIQHSLTETSLYPFQQRAVDWLLRREGVTFSSSGVLEPFTEPAPPNSFRPMHDATGRQCHVSQLRGKVVANLEEAKDDILQGLRGGILAEEMGLGKTVELIALITHHKRNLLKDDILDVYTGAFVKPSGATLIITPPSILEQWIDELQTHAPELKVFHYTGLPPPSAPKNDHASATIENLMRYDVVVTTYAVLAKEIHHATPPPDRSTRHERRHERRSSPLVGISWWRVCLDEAQMVESGVSQAARVARIIPRCNAWAVSGTPLRKDVQDLFGLLLFLRCDYFANKTAVWNHMDKASFKAIFQQIALRHNKDKIRDELRLPPQKRIVITVPFTAIEDQHYTELMRQMCDACWLTPEGLPLEDGRDASDPEVIERMREWLVRLRQTCLHANVGRKNRKALGAKNGALRTVHEVLEVMIEQNDTAWKSEAREMISNKIKIGHVMAFAGDNGNRAHSALDIYEEALKDTQGYVEACRAELLVERRKLGKSMSEQPEVLTAEDNESDANVEKDGEDLGRIPVVRKSLRLFLELEHACRFFIATTYHQIKEKEGLANPNSEEYHRYDKLEVSWYEQAKAIRRELLKESKGRAQQQMAKVSFRKPFHQIASIDDLPGLGGIEARKILETMDNISDFLNAQAEQIQAWRMRIVNILLLPLVDDDDDKDITGDEYDDSLKAQDELYVYIMALRTLVADRNAAVNGLQDLLVEHELKNAEKQAKRKEDSGEERGHAPELVIEVANIRRKLQAGLEGGSLKGVISGIRSLITGLQWRAESGDARAMAELDVNQRHLARIQAIATQEAKTITELEKEQDMFRGTMNQRLEYYRQFQHISDTVAKWKEELDETLDQRELNKYQKLHAKKRDLVAGLKTKHTYLTHLRTENQTEAKPECIICQDIIEIGVLTTCGHKYCKECINTWWHQHRTCPLCKKKLTSSDFKDISFKPTEIKAQEEAPTQSPSSSSTTPQASTPVETAGPSIYTSIHTTTLQQIKTIDLPSSYGTKIDSIARHLLYLRATDPGAKSIIFSQFSDFLLVLRSALRAFKIGSSSITERDGIARFKSDPAVEVFLLDAKSDSSGLNLVNATYVFLCEPLINPALELQAIARVHRIGQSRATTVFMYLIGDTVEEAIYEISVKRRLEHLGKGSGNTTSTASTATAQNDLEADDAQDTQTTTHDIKEESLDQANSKELRDTSVKQLLRKKGDGEIVHESDLWKCLFGRPRKAVKPVLMEREVQRLQRGGAAEERRIAAIAAGEAGEGEVERWIDFGVYRD
ncbi:ATP-dependent DNA helicase [Plenodomus tracheiphilus IPT5]|uniref:ATP-dependent DNA helicase n=1 Tax=Plenodomus tracheiphilus IPT5 TaxID=1408161 RepID=A0A6A7BH99_9PLEO|nr:ATP-dependent DNA helicase [Plenodomus tracheiphilus IPT5]